MESCCKTIAPRGEESLPGAVPKLSVRASISLSSGVGWASDGPLGRSDCTWKSRLRARWGQALSFPYSLCLFSMRAEFVLHILKDKDHTCVGVAVLLGPAYFSGAGGAVEFACLSSPCTSSDINQPACSKGCKWLHLEVIVPR